ncbi:hypothetical protein SESBI_38736 [Sesbania bispinosa]|nr:hypothetical protein SESBI_38736 [Sesbania bispinosa]
MEACWSQGRERRPPDTETLRRRSKGDGDRPPAAYDDGSEQRAREGIGGSKAVRKKMAPCLRGGGLTVAGEGQPQWWRMAVTAGAAVGAAGVVHGYNMVAVLVDDNGGASFLIYLFYLLL